LSPGSGIGKKSGSGSGINNPDHISASLTFFLLFGFEYYPSGGFGMGKIRIRDKHPGTAMLVDSITFSVESSKINLV
jgi:hypothetical protein